jgi:Uma2 family endonuclease
MPSGDLPSFVAGEIFASLREYVRTTQRGTAHAGGVGYAVDELSSGRESFSPDASYYDRPRPANSMRFVVGAPNFAAEVRSENDYTPTADREIADKRADYFAAGTQVVWDRSAQANGNVVSGHRPKHAHRLPRRRHRQRRARGSRLDGRRGRASFVLTSTAVPAGDEVASCETV